MARKKKKFADDGWAIWVDGNDTSTIYINEWLNPKGKSYVDLAVKIVGIRETKSLNVYIPFVIAKSEIEDISLKFNDTNILRAVFSASCIIDYKKNERTSEVAYHGRTMDIVHISACDFSVKPVAVGSLLSVNIEALLSSLDNDEGYFIFRIPHKSLNEVFKTRVSVGKIMGRIRESLLSPVISENYGYSVRINESRLLPDEINKIGAFHRQRLKKAVVSISINDKYEINDSNCYRVRRLEEGLYKNYAAKDFNCTDVITYQWSQTRSDDLLGHFNFYFGIAKNALNKVSFYIYIVLFILLGAAGNATWDLVKFLIRTISSW